MEGNIVSIMGSPGSGKTFLSEKLYKAIKNSVLIPEPLLTDHILENLKEEKNNLETLLYFLKEGIKNMRKALDLKAQGKLVVMDGCWISTVLHIKPLLAGFEREIMEEFTEELTSYLPKPDNILCLTMSDEEVIKALVMRGNEFDTSDSYQQRVLAIKHEHDNYFNEKEKGIVVSRWGLDFEKEQDLQKILDVLEL